MRLNFAPACQMLRPDPAEIDLPADELHVWWIRLHVETSALCACWDLLSPEEAVRASTYRSASDRREFLVTRAALRHVLAQYTGYEPAGLIFDFGSAGKPMLAGSQEIHFSVSHTSHLALLAVARNPIGVDVQQMQGGAFSNALLEQSLSSDEQHYVQALPPEARRRALYRCWVGKEAVLKALGTGLLYPPQAVTVLPAGRGLCMVTLLNRNWLIRLLSAPSGYAAGVAVEQTRIGSNLRLREHEFPVSAFFEFEKAGDRAHLTLADSRRNHPLFVE
jgi:4'-phosphopantetheinyl transferase